VMKESRCSRCQKLVKGRVSWCCLSKCVYMFDLIEGEELNFVSVSLRFLAFERSCYGVIHCVYVKSQ